MVGTAIYSWESLKEIESLKHPPVQENVKWLYSCPDYVNDYYNCNTTRFMNMTGKYCGDRLTCENEYEVIE